MNERDEKGLDRRTFLAQMAAVGIGATTLAACARGAAGSGVTPAGSSRTPMRIGLQLYTVRDLLGKDFEGTIEKVAQIGYTDVEFAGYNGRTPQQVRALLDRLNIKSSSSHIGAQLMQQNAQAQIDAAKTIGQTYITIPSYNFGRNGIDGWKAGAANFNKWGALCKDAGLKLAYHNHNAEFAAVEGGPTGYDVLVRETDPALVDFELDIYWATFADQTAPALIAKFPKRITMWHVKDLVRAANGNKSMTAVGQGTIDYKTLFAHAQEYGLKQFFVEHDSAADYPGGSLASIQASYTFLKPLVA